MVNSRTVYFFDGNHAGVLYCGTEADVDLLRQHGGSPMRWNGAHSPAVGSTITVIVDDKKEQWPVERPNFAQ
jgi:hypothetical protein